MVHKYTVRMEMPDCFCLSKNKNDYVFLPDDISNFYINLIVMHIFIESSAERSTLKT